ncbi:MAG: anti-sigma factor antagonist, partial [Anaerotignaceae bacterium]
MEIKIKNIKNSLVVCPLGEIDHHSAEELKREIEKCCQSYRCKNIIIDFKGVTFMDSAGIGMIIGRYKYTHALGG